MVAILVSLIIASGTLSAAHRGSPDFAAAPQEAAIQIAGGSVVRTNRWGRYATVYLAGAGLEGAPPKHELILVEHFSFGWQPLESLDFRCRLSRHVPDPAAQATLLHKTMTVRADPSACTQTSNSDADAGPPPDVEAVRRLDRGPLVPQVVVAGRFALAVWYGAGGGSHLFEKFGGRWRIIAGSGGAPDAEWLQHFHVPRSSWCTLLSNAPPCTVRGHRSPSSLGSRPDYGAAGACASNCG